VIIAARYAREAKRGKRGKRSKKPLDDPRIMDYLCVVELLCAVLVFPHLMCNCVHQKARGWRQSKLESVQEARGQGRRTRSSIQKFKKSIACEGLIGLMGRLGTRVASFGSREIGRSGSQGKPLYSRSSSLRAPTATIPHPHPGACEGVSAREARGQQEDSKSAPHSKRAQRGSNEEKKKTFATVAFLAVEITEVNSARI
jgi:hypothetical protein